MIRNEGYFFDQRQEYIEDLSDPYRAVILLHDVQGLTNPEIAEMLGYEVIELGDPILDGMCSALLPHVLHSE